MNVDKFNAIYENSFNFVLKKQVGTPSPQLKKFLKQIYTAIQIESFDLNDIKATLIELLKYLCSSKGRTSANCWMTDSFFNQEILKWGDCPENYIEIFSGLSSALHDSVDNPEIAWNFENTPEQLLIKAEQL